MKRFSGIFILCLLVVGCGGSSSSEEDTSTTSSSALAVTFPSDLALASPTASSSASASLNALKKVEASELEADADYLTKKAAIEDLLSGEATTVEDCAFTLNLLTNTNNASCYGPTITYTNHPNATTKDSNTTDADAANSPNDTDGDGSLPGGDTGIWRSTVDGTTEACAAGQANAKISGIATQVDSAMLAMASMICIADVSGLALPAEGASLDLTTQVASGFSTNDVGLTVTSATLARDDDDADGNAVYLANLVGTGTTAAGSAQTVAVRLKHIPTTADNSTYKGKLSFTVSTDDGTKPGNCSQMGVTVTGQTDAVSIGYEKTSTSSLTYELNSGNFCGKEADPYVSTTNFTVDSSKRLQAPTTVTGWGNNYNYALFNYNPSDGTGDFQFAWQAGAGDGNTRVMNVSVETSGGVTTGTAFFGFGPAVFETDAGTIDRMICNWAGPNGAVPANQHTGVAFAQKQVMTLDATSGLFIPSSSNITYAPTMTYGTVSACNSDGTDGSGNTFTFTDDKGNAVSTSVTNNLVAVSTIATSVSAPTPPTDVDE